MSHEPDQYEIAALANGLPLCVFRPRSYTRVITNIVVTNGVSSDVMCYRGSLNSVPVARNAKGDSNTLTGRIRIPAGQQFFVQWSVVGSPVSSATARVSFERVNGNLDDGGDTAVWAEEDISTLTLVGPNGGTITINADDGILVSDPDGSSIAIFDENPGSGAVIQAQPADVVGHTFTPAEFSTIAGTTGTVLNIDGPGIDGVSPAGILFESQLAAPQQLIIISADSNIGSQIINATSIFTVIRGGNKLIEADYTTDTTTLHQPKTVVNGALGTAWVKPALGAGWTNRGGIFADFQYRLVAGNQLQIVGEIVPGTLVDGTVIVTLPVGFRPVDPMLIPCRKGASAVAFLLVSSNGQVAIFDGAGAAIVQIVPTLIPLDSTT